MILEIFWNKGYKILKAPDYNFIFEKKTGAFMVWGKTPEDNPDFCPYGPNIFDIEVTTKCSGINSGPCSFCYKSNNPTGTNMSLDTFKMVLDKMPETLCQIAIGADATLTSNSDLWAMMDYALSKNIVPNITCANISKEVAQKLAKRVGAVAVSLYPEQ